MSPAARALLVLVLEDGSAFEGDSLGAPGETFGGNYGTETPLQERLGLAGERREVAG